jgi:twitching motility protein PilT
MPIEINSLLKKAIKINASDLIIKAGSLPIARINGILSPMKDEQKLTSEDTKAIAGTVMSDQQREVFLRKNDIDISYSIPGLGRFRCNCFNQRGTTSVVFRVVPMKPLDIEELNLPVVLRKISMVPRGLILVTGTTGSGKSTTLATMVDYINSNKSDHIITIEDPIEYLHRDKNSVVNQREIGADTESFSKALRAALRQDPDVILVGEMRDFETIQTAILAAETGHLVLSTLHTVDATETINRIITVFPPYQHKQVRLQLASVLQAIISMRLVPRADGTGRVPAVEILIATERVKACIEDPDQTKLIHDVIADGFSQYGMQTFDQSLLSLYREGHISYEEALSRATKPNDFALKVKGIHSTKETSQSSEEFFGGEKGPEIQRFAK